MIKIQIKKHQQIWFTSDTHYNHKNLCDGVTEWKKTRPGETRDFKTLEDMNNLIIHNINAVVNENDILFHFGDWSFGGIEQIWNFRKQIKCKNIYLFFGNHDHHIINNKVLPNCYDKNDDYVFIDGPNPNTYGDGRDRLFDVQSQKLFTWCDHYGEFELIYPNESKNKKSKRFKFIGMHYPIASWDKLGQGRIHLHGHLHSSKKRKIHQGRSMDVGVDGNNFKPYNIQDIINLMSKRKNRFTKLKYDHHVVFSKFFRIFN